MKLVYFLPFLIVFVLTPAFAYNSAFRPIYQPPSVSGGSNATELYCTFGEFLNSYNSTTNSFTCGAGGGGGENNTASSSGVGYSLVLPKIGVDLPFRGIFCAGDLSCSSNTTDIRISYDTPASSSLKVNNQSAQNDFSITGINNVTGAITTNQFSVNTMTCSGSDVISSIDNVTGYVTCVTPIPGGSGFDTIASSPQTTATILADNSTITNTATIKTLTQGIGITLTNGSNAVTIATTAGAFKNPLLDGSNHTDTVSASPPNRGDLIYGDSSNLWNDLPIGGANTYLKSDGTDVSWQSVSASGGATSLGSNVTASNTAAYSNLWKITLTANSGNVVNGVIVASTGTAGVAPQIGANLTSVAAAHGWCLYQHPTSATAIVNDLVVLSTTTTDTGETLFIPAINDPQPIFFTCTITVGASPPNLWINMQPEAAGTVTAKAGSYYIKTP